MVPREAVIAMAGLVVVMVAAFAIWFPARRPWPTLGLKIVLLAYVSLATAVGAYATTPAGRWTGAPLDGRPLHFESALV